MTLDDFAKELDAVKAGQYARLPYDVYSDLFPPGEPDEGARERCYDFARARGFRIENRPDDQAVLFVKDA